MGFIESISGKIGFVSLEGASRQEVDQCEEALGLKFAEDYREYAIKYGAASCYGHELTGVCTIPTLNVVSVTNKERAYMESVPKTWYVIEQAHIDGIVYWQDNQGIIYRTAPKVDVKKICESLADYIELW